MSTELTIATFLGSLVVSVTASIVLAQRLEQVAYRFGFPAGLLGMVTALGANSPEFASAASALISGQHELGRGVIFGSNIFNLIALIGLTAVLTGGLLVPQANIIVNAGVALGITLVIGAQAIGWMGPLPAGALIGFIFAPYLWISASSPSRLGALPLPSAATHWLASAVSAAGETNNNEQDLRRLTRVDALSILPLITVIVVGSIVMVRTAEQLGEDWGIRKLVLGMFVIATLTGLPNLIAAIRLGLRQRGAALMSEACNSNTLNLLVGFYVPSLLINIPSPSHAALLSVLWLVGLTMLTMVIGTTRTEFSRVSGGLLVGSYAAFVGIVIFFVPS